MMAVPVPPPPPPIACVQAEQARGYTYIVISGDPGQVGAILSELKSPWAVEAHATDHGVSFARLRAPVDVPYREIGGLITAVQRRQLTANFFVSPPICGMEDI